MQKNSKDLDAIDRTLLGLLTQDAEQSYAVLGKKVGLSAPAVHERVKRYKSTGRIKAVAALLDPKKTGKEFLAFIHINTTGWGKTDDLMRFSEFPEVEEIHSVTGDACMLMKVRMESADAMEIVTRKVICASYGCLNQKLRRTLNLHRAACSIRYQQV